jgi:hypothetical protein
MSPGAKTCNGRAAVSRAARNQAPATKPCPTQSCHALNRTTQRIERPKNQPRPASAAQQDPAILQGGGHRPGEPRSQKQGKTPVSASLTAPDARLSQRNTTAAAAKQQTQTTPKGGQTQATANLTSTRRPKTLPYDNMHNYRRKHAADPERRARRKVSKKRSQNNTATVPCEPSWATTRSTPMKGRSHDLHVKNAGQITDR